jgi:hypothetical protein
MMYNLRQNEKNKSNRWQLELLIPYLREFLMILGHYHPRLQSHLGRRSNYRLRLDLKSS